MNIHPLTPPRDPYSFTSSGAQEEEDIDFHKKWLECQGIKINSLIHEHNRVTIPIEEDIGLLVRLKERVESLPEDASIDETVAEFFKQFTEEAAESESKSRTAAFKYYMAPIPNDICSDLHSFLRSRSSISADRIIRRVIPYLFERIDAARLPVVARVEDRTLSGDVASNYEELPEASIRAGAPKAKSHRKMYRVEKLAKVGANPSKTFDQVSRNGKSQGSAPTRKSSRLQERLLKVQA